MYLIEKYYCVYPNIEHSKELFHRDHAVNGIKQIIDEKLEQLGLLKIVEQRHLLGCFWND